MLSKLESNKIALKKSREESLHPNDDVNMQILREFPSDFLNSIKSLSYDGIKSYQFALDEHVRSALISWLHNNTRILEQCGSYSVEEITGFILWQLWKDLRREGDEPSI